MEKINKNIGVLTRELIVFGGIYSNLEALKAFKSEMDTRGIKANNIICTGDIVAYCADPEECIQFVKNWGIHVIVGNVELQLRNGEVDCGCNFNENTSCDVLSRHWYPFAKHKISIQSIQWLHTLPHYINLTFQGKKGLVLHGGLEEISQFIFKSTDPQIKNEILRKTQSEFILAGHCGIPFYEELSEGIWFNSGVIGMPANDGQTSTWYLELTENQNFKPVYHKLSYDFELASNKMIQESLPSEYAKTLTTGVWDNCDVLPERETKAQGQSLNI
jgi:predicted phosphodiesterase